MSERFKILVAAAMVAATFCACSPDERADGDDQGDDDDGTGDVDAATGGTIDAGGGGFVDAGGGASDGGGGPAGDSVVYAHSSSELYRVDPDTFDVTLIGPFVWEMGIFDSMTDIAIDKNGGITGVSFNRVYHVDPATAVTTFLAPLARQFNGLSYIPAGTIDGSTDEILVGSTLDGSFWRIDPLTGTSTEIGAYGGGWSSSGDIVSVDGFGTYATVQQGEGIDYLAQIDPLTGIATTIGTGTGFDHIWGLGFWKGKIFGFTDLRQFVLIDPATGVATLVEDSSVFWWGAGVTTSAPIIP